MRAIVALRAGALTVFAGIALQPAAGAAPGPRTALTGAARGAYTDLGAAPQSLRIRLAVVLRYRNESALEHLVASRGAVGAAQFRAAFAPSAATYSKTIAALEKLGLRVEHTYANRTVIDASGTPAAIASDFGTQIDEVREPGGTLAYTNVRPAYLPAELAGDVYGIAGLDGRRLLETDYRRGTASLAPLGSFRSDAATSPRQGPDGGFSPRSYARAYDFPILHKIPGRSGAVYDGTGQAAAIVIDADFLDSDLETFEKYFKIVPTGPAIKRIPIQGGPPPGLVNDSIETMLDVDTILATAPGVALSVYEMNSLLYSSVIDAYNQIDTDDDVGAVNSSFGGCEAATDPAYFPALSDYLAMQGEALGIVFAASTGDSGSVACEDGTNPDGVATPASGPHFIAAGGTSLFVSSKDDAYLFEYGWSGSGGGVSVEFPTPAYQTGLANIVGTTRNIPDIAFEADPGAGESMFIGGRWIGPIGGTSLSCPLFVGLATEYAQYHGGLLGDLHAPLYATYAATKRPPFHGIKTGFNGYYYALPGYDQVTGLGSIEAWNYALSGQL
jgi:kumamolisin